MLADKLKNNINIPILLLWIIGFGFYFCGMPKYIDDIWYLSEFKPWFDAQGIATPEDGGNLFSVAFPWESFRENVIYRYNYDNIRLTNILALFFLLLPKWAGSGIMTLLLGWTAVLAMKLAALDWRKSPGMPILLFLLTFCMPWKDQFGSLDYQFNYILPGWLGLFLYLLLQKNIRGQNRCLSTFILGFVLGMLHEGFSLPFATGLTFLYIFYGTWRRKEVLFAIAGLTAGFCILLSIPAITDVILNPTKNTSSGVIGLLHYYIIDNTPIFFIMIMLWIVTIARLRPSRILRDAIFPFIILQGIILIVIVMKTYAGIRAIYWVNLTSIVGIMRIIRLNFPKSFRFYSVPTILSGVFLLSIIYIHLGYVGYYSLQFRRQRAELELRYIRERTPFMFGEIITINKTSAWAMNLPCEIAPGRVLEQEETFLLGKSNKLKWIPIIPEELSKASISNSRQAGEGSQVRELAGYFFTPAENISPREQQIWKFSNIRIELGNGHKFEHKAFPFRFRSEADGREYCWLYFELPWFVRHFRPAPTSVWLPADPNTGK